jgi:hypothetical protein
MLFMDIKKLLSKLIELLLGGIYTNKSIAGNFTLEPFFKSLEMSSHAILDMSQRQLFNNHVFYALLNKYRG